jgi:exopolysaccharide production protein ExoQ
LPSLLGLVLCSAFVAFLLRLEHRQAPEVSRALWIPTSWLLVTMSRPLGGWLNIQGTLEGGSPIDRAFLLCLLGANFVILSRRNFDWAGALKKNSWLLALFAYMTVSVFWSSIPLVSFKRWMRELCAITTALVILSEQHPRIAVKSLLRRMIYILVPFSLLLIKYFPSLGCTYGYWGGELWWTGATDQKNHLAKLCILSIYFIVWVLWQRRRGRDMPVIRRQVLVEVGLLLLSLYLFMGPQRSLTYSATSTIALATGVLAFAGLLWANKAGWKIGRTALGLSFVLIMLYGTVTPFLQKLTLFDVSSLVRRNATLTDRTTGIWGPLVPLAMSRPLTGHGLGGFWTDAMRQKMLINSAHNGFLDLLLDYGFIGLGFMILFILSCSAKALRTLADDLDWGILFVGLIFMALIHNITESSISSLTSTTTALLLIFSVAVPSPDASSFP